MLKKGFACLLLLCVATDRLAATHPKIILRLPLSPLSSTSSFAVSPIIYCSSSFFCFFGAFCVIVGHTFVPFLPSTRDPIKERHRLPRVQRFFSYSVFKSSQRKIFSKDASEGGGFSPPPLSLRLRIIPFSTSVDSSLSPLQPPPRN